MHYFNKKLKNLSTAGAISALSAP